MPLGMGRLINLQIPSDFIVGKAMGKGIAEFKDLSHLRGSISILCLHNFDTVRDAIEARLKDKKHLDDLVLEWSSSSDGSRNEEIETEVLDALQPHENLKKLTIKYYGEKLHIRKCGALTIFSQNPALGNLEPVDFPSMQLLVLVGCGDLENLPFSLPLLKVLEIDGCGKLAALPRMVELSTRYLMDSNAELLGWMMGFSSLTSQHLTHIPHVKCLPEGFIQQCEKLEELSLSAFPDLEYLADDQVGLAHLASLQRLTISNCPELVALPDEDDKLPPVLQYLDLKHGHSLMKLLGKFHNLECLAELQIEWCSNIEAFPEMGLPDKLKRLVICDCGALKTLPQELLCNNNILEYLEVHKCPSLVSILDNGNFPSTLTHLKVYYCKTLRSLPEG
ncbi:hypothetical protein ACLB2K_077490 [Fragaria x ananassa]